MNEMNASTRAGIVNIRVTDITPEYAEEILKLNTSKLFQTQDITQAGYRPA